MNYVGQNWGERGGGGNPKPLPLRGLVCLFQVPYWIDHFTQSATLENWALQWTFLVFPFVHSTLAIAICGHMPSLATTTKKVLEDYDQKTSSLSFASSIKVNYMCARLWAWIFPATINLILSVQAKRPHEDSREALTAVLCSYSRL